LRALVAEIELLDSTLLDLGDVEGSTLVTALAFIDFHGVLEVPGIGGNRKLSLAPSFRCTPIKNGTTGAFSVKRRKIGGYARND
jgi:hypothetical protein